MVVELKQEKSHKCLELFSHLLEYPNTSTYSASISSQKSFVNIILRLAVRLKSSRVFLKISHFQGLRSFTRQLLT